MLVESPVSVDEDPNWQEDLALLVSRTGHHSHLLMGFMVSLGLCGPCRLSLSW